MVTVRALGGLGVPGNGERRGVWGEPRALLGLWHVPVEQEANNEAEERCFTSPHSQMLRFL